MADREMIRIPPSCPIRLFDGKGQEFIQWIPLDTKVPLYNQEKEVVSRKTWKKKKMSGFALAANKGKAGRPKGTRTRANINNAIKHFEAHQYDAARMIVAVMKGDEAFVGGTIRPAERVAAAKYVIEAPNKLNGRVPQQEQVAVKKETDADTEDSEVKPLIHLQVQQDGSLSKSE